MFRKISLWRLFFFLLLSAVCFSYFVFPVAAQPGISISLMVPYAPEDAHLLVDQVEEFSAINPEFDVEVAQVPYADYYDTLLTRIAAGQPPDVALLPYNSLASLQSTGDIVPLGELLSELDISLDPFLGDAVASTMFDGEIFGIPLRRSACQPEYTNLVLFSASPEPEGAMLLMDYLAQEQQQVQNLESLSWYPTLEYLYEEFALDCDNSVVNRPSVDEVAAAVEIANGMNESLQSLLEGASLNPYRSSILVEDVVQVVLSPMITPISEIQFLETFEEGIVIGSIFVNPESDAAAEFGASGEFVVRCSGEPEATTAVCALISESEYIELDATVELLEAPVGPPSALAVMGSIEGWFYIDGRMICFRLF